MVVYTNKFYIYKKPESLEGLGETRLVHGRVNPELCQEVAGFLGAKILNSEVKNFADGEVSIKYNESVRGKDVFLVQSICRNGDLSRSVNDAAMETYLMICALRRHRASSITAVIPYFGYARQDRTNYQRVPISARNLAQMLCAAGVDHVVCCDLHCGQAQGFFPNSVGMDDLRCGPVGSLYFLENILDPKTGVVVVSPEPVAP